MANLNLSYRIAIEFMIDELQDHLDMLRVAYADAVIEGKTTQAGYLQSAIHKTYDLLADLTYLKNED